MRLVLYRRLTWRQGAWAFAAASLASLSVALCLAWQTGVELRTWPRVEARVDTADVATVGGVSDRPIYAARFRLAYGYQGRDYRTSTTLRQEWSDYNLAATDAARALAAGHVLVMLDPDRPGSPVPREGSGISFIFAGLFGLFSVVFAAFGMLAWRAGIGRRRGGMHP